ncbi:hypothetical protein ACWGLG_16055 [Streptomyces antimycoticus]
MTLHLPRPHGRHRAPTLAEHHDLQARLAASEKKNDDIAIDYCGLKQRYEAAVEEIRRLQQQRINDAIEKAHLRRELANAQPRITRIDSQADQPHDPASIPLRAA